LLALSGCGGAQQGPSVSALADTPSNAPRAEALTPAPPRGPSCLSTPLVPPTGYLQETQFGAPSEQDVVGPRALAALRAKVCGSDCAPLDADFSLWAQDADATRACAMAVVKRERVEAWRRAALSSEALDAQLEAAARALVASGARAAVVRIEDAGAPGGARAQWLAPRLGRALQAAGASLVEATPGPVPCPPSATHCVTGVVTPRLEDQVPVLELGLSASVAVKGGGATLRHAPAVVFPAGVAPANDTPLTPGPPSDAGLQVRLDQRATGLCGGERTQLWLNVDAPLHVRVFDLYGADGAMLLFAGHVAPGPARSLGEFEAVPLPGQVTERFLVVAAPQAASLGDLAALSQTCRLDATRARQMHAFQGLPLGARVAHDAFRVSGAPPCAPLDPARRHAALALLNEVPLCP